MCAPVDAATGMMGGVLFGVKIAILKPAQGLVKGAGAGIEADVRPAGVVVGGEGIAVGEKRFGAKGVGIDAWPGEVKARRAGVAPDCSTYTIRVVHTWWRQYGGKCQ